MIKILVYLNLTITILLIGGFYWYVFVFRPTPSYLSQQAQSENAVGYVDTCGENCKKQIEDAVAIRLAAMPQATPSKETTIVEKVVVSSSPKATQTTYISLTGPITTTSSSWYDVPGTEFTLDLAGFGSKAGATWDASLKVAHDNGTAYVRLYDVTHGIAVNGSELSLTDTSALTQVYSGALSFWAGNNKYRVQLKSLNTFEVTFGSGRVKITY